MPRDIPENTVELLLYENQISSIPPGVFSELSVYTDLEMRRNNITEIGARAFEGFDIDLLSLILAVRQTDRQTDRILQLNGNNDTGS